MKTVWALVALFAAGCFTEPGFAPPGWDAGDAAMQDLPSNPRDTGPAVDQRMTQIGLTLPDVVRIRAGDSVDLDVEIERGDASGAVSIDVLDLPDGVTAESEGVEASGTRAVVTLSATAEASVGGPVVATVVATVAGAEGRTPLPVVVAGTPGSDDVKFGVNGSAGLSAAGGDDTVASVLLDAQARVVVAGRSAGGETTGYAIALQNDGRLDDSFGVSGMFTSLGGVTSSVVGAVYSDGLALNARIDGVPKLLRVTTDGELDTDWGTPTTVAGAGGPLSTNGLLAVWAGDDILTFEDSGLPTHFDAPADLADVAIDSDGRYLVGHLGTMVVSRLTLDGGLDPAFGTSGSLNIGGNYAIADLAPWADGGAVIGVGATESVVARFDVRGELVSGFAGDGVLTLGTDEGQTLLSDGTGVIVVAQRGATNVLIRYRADGIRDLSFGSGGEVVLGESTGPVRLGLDDLAGRVLVAFPVGADIEVRRIWL